VGVGTPSVGASGEAGALADAFLEVFEGFLATMLVNLE
jgi:hypothetical protein